jgi:hypothetical protein
MWARKWGLAGAVRAMVMAWKTAMASNNDDNHDNGDDSNNNNDHDDNNDGNADNDNKDNDDKNGDCGQQQ